MSETGGELVAELLITLHPGAEVLVGRQPVALRVIAASVGEDEIVAQVGRIAGPGDEVVYFRRGRLQNGATVKTPRLKLLKHSTDDAEICPFAAEEELGQIGRFTDYVQVLLADVSKPRTRSEINS